MRRKGEEADIHPEKAPDHAGRYGSPQKLGVFTMRNFFQRVYQIVAQIPEGKVATYGQIAALIEPWNARVMGWAMHKAPKKLNLPCHRVVNKSGSMGPGYLFAPGEQQTRCAGRRRDLQHG